MAFVPIDQCINFALTVSGSVMATPVMLSGLGFRQK
jgi:hypothetical protein